MKPVPTIEPLMTLADGARLIGLEASQLRTEIRKGRLTHVVVAGKHFVTESDLRDMVTRCRVERKAPDCTLDMPEPIELRGLSSTEQSNVARDAALKSAQALKKRSRTTSPASTSQPDAKAP